MLVSDNLACFFKRFKERFSTNKNQIKRGCTVRNRKDLSAELALDQNYLINTKVMNSEAHGLSQLKH